MMHDDDLVHLILPQDVFKQVHLGVRQATSFWCRIPYLWLDLPSAIFISRVKEYEVHISIVHGVIIQWSKKTMIGGQIGKGEVQEQEAVAVPFMVSWDRVDR